MISVLLAFVIYSIFCIYEKKLKKNITRFMEITYFKQAIIENCWYIFPTKIIFI